MMPEFAVFLLLALNTLTQHLFIEIFLLTLNMFLLADGVQFLFQGCIDVAV